MGEVATILVVLRINVKTNTAKFRNIRIAIFGQNRYLVGVSEVFVEDKPRLRARWVGW